jgi:hypothetical protein
MLFFAMIPSFGDLRVTIRTFCGHSVEPLE